MSILRVKKDPNNPYVMINKEMINDKELSMRATGLLCYMLSLPDDWEFYETELKKHFPEGKKAIHSTIEELIKLGYIIKGEQIRNEHGRFGSYDYEIHEVSIRVPLRGDRQTVDREVDTTNNNLTNNDNNNILHQLKIDDDIFEIIEKYAINRFGKGLRKSNNYNDMNILEGCTHQDIVSFLDDNVQSYNQCNLDYIEIIQQRAK